MVAGVDEKGPYKPGKLMGGLLGEPYKLRDQKQPHGMI